MKKHLFFFTFIFFITSSIAQFGPQQIIDNQITSITIVRAGDLDNDGDLDLAACLFNQIVWYENLDGNANYGSPTVLATDLIQTFSLNLADLDGDSDLDILFTSFDNGTVSWVENLDGLGNFSAPILITNTIPGANDVLTADIDGDNDMDIVVNSPSTNQVLWSENTDGNGTFGAFQVVTSTNTNGRSIISVDIDNDNDNDIVTSSFIDTSIVWFENIDGLGTFNTGNIIAGSAPSVEDIYAIDIDGDLDLDIVSGTNSNDRVAWHENLDGMGSFGPQQIISNEADFVRSVFAADLDNDGDADVLSASSSDGKIAWYENLDGLGSFGPQQILETEADGTRSVIEADIDGDGDQDVIGTLRIDDKLTWYENLTILGVNDNVLEDIIIYPNPTSQLLHIETKKTIIKKAIVHNLFGQVVLQTSNTQTIDLSHLTAGVYFVTLESNEGSLVRKVIKQ